MTANRNGLNVDPWCSLKRAQLIREKTFFWGKIKKAFKNIFGQVILLSSYLKV